MWHRWVPIVLVAVAACKSKSPEKEQAQGSPAPKLAPAAPAADAPAAKPERGKLAPAQLVELRTHMRAAWAAQKASKWTDAVDELEAALKIAPGDARALAELGFSAMNAGDLPKARTIDEQAIRVALDPKVKAAGLYNLGVVQHKLGDTAAAYQSFTQSLALRPNKTVEAELAKLGTGGDVCPAGKPVCYCAVLDQWGSVEGDPADSCQPTTETASPVPGWHVYRVNVMNGKADVLVDEHDRVVTAIAGDDDSTRHTANSKLAKGEVRTVGKHRVAWLEVASNDWVQTMDENDNVTDDGSESTVLTVCVIGDQTTPTRCPLRDAPRSAKHSLTHTKMNPDGTFTDEGRGESTETVVEYKLADDGTVSAKLVKGNKADAVPAPTKLW